MSISPLDPTNQTTTIPNSLLGYSSNGISAIEINPTSITIAGNLTTTPIYVGISAATGLTTTLATGLDVNCDFNMNDNNITNLNSISGTSDLTISGSDIYTNCQGLEFDAGTYINLLCSNGNINLTSSDNAVINSTGLQVNASDFITMTANNDTMSFTADDTITLTSNSMGISLFGGNGDGGNNDIVLTTQNGGNISITSATNTLISAVNSVDLTGINIGINATDNVNITAGEDNISMTAKDNITLTSTEQSIIMNSTNGNITTNSNGIDLTSSGSDITLTTDQIVNIISPTGTYFNTTTANTGNGSIYCYNVNSLTNLNLTTATGLYVNISDQNVGDGVVVASSFIGNLSGSSTSTTNVLTTSDNTSGTYYLPFVKTSGTSNKPYFIDDTTGPLSYNPSTATLTSTNFNGLLNTGGLVFLSTGSQAINGSASATNISLTGIFNSTYENYRIVLYPTTQVTFTAYPSYSLQAFLGTGTLPTTASLYGFELISSNPSLVNPVYTLNATISSAPLILAVSQLTNHQTIIEIENVGYTASASQQIGLKCKSFYSNPGITGASDRSILATNVSGSTITGLTIQQTSISVGNNMTIGWTIYGYK